MAAGRLPAEYVANSATACRAAASTISAAPSSAWTMPRSPPHAAGRHRRGNPRLVSFLGRPAHRPAMRGLECLPQQTRLARHGLPPPPATHPRIRPRRQGHRDLFDLFDCDERSRSGHHPHRVVLRLPISDSRPSPSSHVRFASSTIRSAAHFVTHTAATKPPSPPPSAR